MTVSKLEANDKGLLFLTVSASCFPKAWQQNGWMVHALGLARRSTWTQENENVFSPVESSLHDIDF